MTPRTGRSNTSLVLALLALLSFAACGGGTGGSGTDGGGDGTNSGETAAGETPTQPPAAGGGGDLPDIADGLYAAGTVHLEVSGDKSLNVDLALIPGASSTTNGATLLFYGSGEGQDATALTIVLEAEAGPGFNLTSPVVLSAGGRASGCRFEVTTNDGSGLEGTFSCSGIDGMVAGGLENPQIDVRATFSADR